MGKYCLNVYRLYIHIADPAADRAAYVAVVVGVVVVMEFVAGTVDGGNVFPFDKNSQIAVNGAETDSGQAFPHSTEDIVRGRVTAVTDYLLQHNLPLFRASAY